MTPDLPRQLLDHAADLIREGASPLAVNAAIHAIAAGLDSKNPERCARGLATLGRIARSLDALADTAD